MARKYAPVVESIEFNGIIFRRHLTANTWSDRVYYRPGSKYIKQGIGSLHREIWKSVHAEIPPDHDIHHKDGNPLNNSIDNLECLHKRDHAKHHAETFPEWKKAWLRTKMPEVSSHKGKWQQSDEGREFYREHGKACWAKRTESEYQCEWCGKTFRAKTIQTPRFCSNNCKARARYHSGVDNECRTCEECGNQFTCNKYNKIRFCSDSCAAKDRERKKQASGLYESEKWKREHSEVSKKHWEHAQFIDLICEHCGKPFQTRALHGNARFCSAKCKQAARRKSGVDNESAVCVICNMPFMRNKYEKPLCCSSSCGAKYRHKKKRLEQS